MKAHGIAPNAAATRPTAQARTPKAERHGSGAMVTPSKKRKTDAFEDEHANEDDAEDYEDQAYIVKTDPEQLSVKEEHSQRSFEAVAHSPTQYMPQSDMADGLVGYGQGGFGGGACDVGGYYMNTATCGFQAPSDSGYGGGASTHRPYLGFENFCNSDGAQPATPTSQPGEYNPIVVD